MAAGRARTQVAADVKVELVLRLLGGETLGEVSRETGRPRRQLSVWRRRFLAGGEAYLNGRPDDAELDALRSAQSELSSRVAELEAENAMLQRRVALLSADPRDAPPHPYSSDRYAWASEAPGVRPLYLPEWGTYVLVRERRDGALQATGIRPICPLEPTCDVQAGLEALQRAGIAAVSLVTDPMWSPEPAALRDAFRVCRELREHYFVDREAPVHYHKRHRNRLNQARRVCVVEQVELVEQLARWHELYAQNVSRRQISQPFTRTYFDRIATLPDLRTVAVLVDGEIVAMTLWLRHRDTLYLHDGAASTTGFELSATYAAVAHVIENEPDCRYILLGGAASLGEDPLEGLAMFRRGFSNGSARSYLCSTTLSRAASAQAA
jgi:hypothetical protein